MFVRMCVSGCVVYVYVHVCVSVYEWAGCVCELVSVDGFGMCVCVCGWDGILCVCVCVDGLFMCVCVDRLG